MDLYADVPGAIRGFRKIRSEHPCEFYLRLGFRVGGVMPDANGPGKPDIFFAKRVGIMDSRGQGGTQSVLANTELEPGLKQTRRHPTRDRYSP